MKNSQKFLDKFNQLKKDFAAKLPARLTEIDDTLQKCMEWPQDDNQLQVLYRLLHSLGGTAGSFGFTQLGLDARKIEGQVAALAGRSNRNQQDIVLVAKAMPQLKRYAETFCIQGDHNGDCEIDERRVSSSWAKWVLSSSTLACTEADLGKIFSKNKFLLK